MLDILLPAHAEIFRTSVYVAVTPQYIIAHAAQRARAYSPRTEYYAVPQEGLP